MLAQTQFTSLLNQEGVTANDIREAYYRSEQHHRHVGEINDAINSSYESAYDSGAELTRRLDTIAEDGNSRIKQIQGSRDPVLINRLQVHSLLLTPPKEIRPANSHSAACALLAASDPVSTPEAEYRNR
jgi:hypothetical protein